MFNHHIQKWKNAVISEDFSYNHFTTLHTSFKNSEEATVKVDFAFRGILECWALNSASCRKHWVCSALYKEPPFSGCGSKKTNLEHLASLRAPFSCLLFNGKKPGYENFLILACSLSIFIFKETVTETMCLFLWLTIREWKGLKKHFEYTLSRLSTTVQLGTQRVPNTLEFLKTFPVLSIIPKLVRLYLCCH